MKNVFIVVFTGLLLLSCKPTLPTDDQVQDLIAAIPDHQFNKDTKHCFTEEYYSLLEHAWAIPSDDMGSDEWLYYFISGNGDSDDSGSPKILDISTTDTGAKVDFEYLEKEHSMNLSFENGKWVIADYDNTLGQLKEYIANQSACKPTLPTDDQVQDLIAAIPDHQFNKDTKHCFTEEYYSLLEHAWAIPSDAIGEIGSDEWLYFFISGNGDSDASGSPRILDISATSTGAKVNFEDLEKEKHNMDLSFENGKWVIADYDNTLDQLKEYIAKQREYFKSNSWQEYLDKIRKEFSVEDADMAEKKVEAYFQEYR